ncbi:hypothetical protein EXIGLDRAFT_789132 [Exidia glandulosa HHB12029]|uniref:Uncharacterized protein n=1 Tax=Exidia glandulosa HHB12029 TaxID=1314781 RepID=A0A166MLQ2_EXIGL|nr:hypothetical protein EXIGLDRAFT_789132 [Exidia glandulosa HHB12029]
MSVTFSIMDEEEAVRLHGDLSRTVGDSDELHAHHEQEVEPAHTHSHDDTIPLVRSGADPGYDIPLEVGTRGMPRGTWRNVSRNDASLKYRCPQHWQELTRVCTICFGAAEVARGGTIVDFQSTNETLRILYNNFETLIRTYPEHIMGGLCRSVRYPHRVSTDTAQGSTTVTYSVSHEVSHSNSITSGYSVGGGLSLRLGGLGEASFSGSYSHSTTNGTTWGSTSSVSSDLQIPDRQWGRIDVYATGGTYNGFLYFPMARFPRHDNNGNRCFNIGNRHIITNVGFFAFPVKDAFVKSPNSPSPAIRMQRVWTNGTPAPGTQFSMPLAARDAAEEEHEHEGLPLE